MEEGLKMHNEVLPGVYVTIAGGFVDIGDYNRASKYYQLASSIDACNGIWPHANMFLAQNKLQQAFEVIEQRCQQSCERLCFLTRFRISLLAGEFDKSELYFAQSKMGNDDFNRYDFLDYEIGYVYYKLGRINESNEILNDRIQKLESLDYKNKWQYLDLSRIYAFKGNRSKAIEYLSESSKGHFSSGIHDFILVDPFFENLRDDPQFKAIVQQAQEEKAALRKQVNEKIARGELDL